MPRLRPAAGRELGLPTAAGRVTGLPTAAGLMTGGGHDFGAIVGNIGQRKEGNYSS